MIGHQFTVTDEQLKYCGGQSLVDRGRMLAEREAAMKIIEILRQGTHAFKLEWKVEEVQRGIYQHTLRITDTQVTPLGGLFFEQPSVRDELLRPPPRPIPPKPSVCKRLGQFLADAWRDAAYPGRMMERFERDGTI